MATPATQGATMNPDLCTISPQVRADDGIVTIEARCGVSYSFTAEAAKQLSEELLRSAARAQGQKRMTAPRGAHFGLRD